MSSQSSQAEQNSSLPSTFLSILQAGAERRMGPVEFLRQVMRDEASDLTLKVLVGIVLAATVMYAILRVGGEFQELARQFENGHIISFAGFMILGLVAGTAFFFVFRDSFKRAAVRRRIRRRSGPALDYELLLLKFAEGLLEGLESQGGRNGPIQAPRSAKPEPVELRGVERKPNRAAASL